MAFAAVTILMDTTHQNFLQHESQFTLRNKRSVAFLYQNLCFLQTCLEEDDYMAEGLEVLITDASVELRFQIERQLRLFYMGKAMKVRLASAQKLLSIFDKGIEATDFDSLYGTLAKHLTLPVSRMPTRIRKRVEFLCTNLGLNHYENGQHFGYRITRAWSLAVKSVIKQELRASNYLNKYKQQKLEARQRLRRIFTLGIKLTGYIKKELLKAKNAYNQSKCYTTSLGRLERDENITVDYSSLHPMIKMVGCDDEFNTVMDMVNRQSLNREIVSIVGMGGIGKTATARRIYHHESMISHFDCWAWVTVSQDYNPTQVLWSLAQSLATRIIDADKDQPAELVYKSLKRQRYLIVIDNIWSVEDWSDLQRCFLNDNNGSQILLTTRLKNVAEFACRGSNSYHSMLFLDFDESWNLFQNKVGKTITFTPEFKAIAKKIVVKCKGLPLAICVAAGLLSNSKHTLNEWEQIAENIRTLSLDHSKQQFGNILDSSYTLLPRHLKLCFLSFAVFPEDYEVHVEHIVYFWVSEGFLKSVKHKSLEDVARESIQDLADRHLVQICKGDYKGNIISLQMHDILRELARREAQKENPSCFQEGDAIFLRHHRIQPTNFSPEVQHWVIQSRSYSDSCLNHPSNFTTFCWNRKDPRYSVWYPLYHFPTYYVLPFNHVYANFELLRILLIDQIDLHFPSSLTVIMSLVVHLRYLAFKTNMVIKFQPWFMLQNLQILVVKTFNGSLEPLGIWELPQLRHLYFSEGIALLPPRSVQNNLETITKLDHRSCKKELFMRIPNLKKLGVFYMKPYVRTTHRVQLVQKSCLFI